MSRLPGPRFGMCLQFTSEPRWPMRLLGSLQIPVSDFRPFAFLVLGCFRGSRHRLSGRWFAPADQDSPMACKTPGLLIDIETRLTSGHSVSLNEIAADLGVHRRTVERAILGATGLTFREYRQRKVLQEAIALLSEDGRISCKRIAIDLGFKSPASFSRFVRCRTGYTPNQLRNRRTS